MSFRIGDKVGDYQIVGVVGAGGAGQVFRVEHHVTGRVEAMKVLLEGRGSETEAPAARFLREIKLQASLDHPNIASVHNAFWVNDELVMIMELVNGVSLDRTISEGRMPMGKALRYAVQSLIALEYAHGRGITHRDIKPENIMVTPDGVVKLMDFGLAKDRNDPRMTELGVVVGSLFYISPEQARGLATVDQRTDVYSFGAVLYEMTTGERAFQYKTSFDLLQAAVNEDPVPPSQLEPEIPPSLEAVILRAMSKDPADRFQSAREFRRTLEAIVRNPGVDVAAAPSSSRPSRPKSVARKRGASDLHERGRRQTKTRALLVGISAVVLAYLGVRTLTRTPDAEAAPPPIVEAAVEAPGAAPDLPKVAPPETGGSGNGFILRQTMRVEGEPTSLAFSHGGEALGAGLEDGRIRTWYAASGERIADLSGADGRIAAITIGGASRRVAAATGSGTAFVWSSAAGAPKPLRHESPAKLVRFSPNGQRLAIAAEDGSVWVWDLSTSQDWTLRGAKRAPKSLAFSPTGPIVAVSDVGKIALWGVGLTDTHENLTSGGPEATAIAFSSNGLEMAAAVGAQIITWDMATRQRSRTYALSGDVLELTYADPTGWIAVSADAKRRELFVWDVAKRHRVTSIRLGRPAAAVALSDSGDRLSAATAEGEVHYWDSLSSRRR